MTSKQLRQYESHLLTKGLNFSFTSKTLPNKDMSTIKDAIKDLEKEETDTFHTKIRLTLQNSKPSQNNLFKNERKAFKQLQFDCNLIVINCNFTTKKERSTVILTRENYLGKCLDHIRN